MSKPWTPKDDEIMRTNAGRISDGEIGKMIGHARETVARHRADASLPAYHASRRNWTRRERLLGDAAGIESEDGEPENAL